MNYIINPLGQRVAKVASNNTYYRYDTAGRLIGEYNATNTNKTEYIYFNNKPIALIRNGAVAYIHTDHLGTPRAVTAANITNDVLWSWKSDPFGKTAPIEKVYSDGSHFVMNLRFAGQYYDVETGLYYNYFRDYDPSIGRYVQSDPIGLEGGLNTYGYVGGNPVMAFDLFGLEQQKRLKYRIMKASLTGLSPDDLGKYSEYYVFVDEKCKTTSTTNPKDVNEFLKRLVGSAKPKIKFDDGDIMSGIPSLGTEFTIEEEYTFSAPSGDTSCNCSETLAGGKYENGLYGMGEVSRWINEQLGIKSPYGNILKPDYQWSK